MPVLFQLFLVVFRRAGSVSVSAASGLCFRDVLKVFWKPLKSVPAHPLAIEPLHDLPVRALRQPLTGDQCVDAQNHLLQPQPQAKNRHPLNAALIVVWVDPAGLECKINILQHEFTAALNVAVYPV